MISIHTVRIQVNIKALKVVSLERFVAIDWVQNHPTVPVILKFSAYKEMSKIMPLAVS